MNSYLSKLSRELLFICLNRDCLPKARASGVSQPVSNSSWFLEFLIFLIPLSTARGRLRAEKKKKLVTMNLASKHKLIYCTAIPFQNAQNNFSM
jgi:hypothetical protein